MRGIVRLADNGCMHADADFAQIFGARLDSAIKRSGKPVEKIAAAAGLDRATVNNWRAGRVGSQGPALFKLIRLAAVLRCDVAYLLAETDAFKIAFGPAVADRDELERCLETVLRRHNNEPFARLAARVAFLYGRRMSIAQGDLDIMQIIDDSFPSDSSAG